MSELIVHTTHMILSGENDQGNKNDLLIDLLHGLMTRKTPQYICMFSSGKTPPKDKTNGFFSEYGYKIEANNDNELRTEKDLGGSFSIFPVNITEENAKSIRFLHNIIVTTVSDPISFIAEQKKKDGCLDKDKNVLLKVVIYY